MTRIIRKSISVFKILIFLDFVLVIVLLLCRDTQATLRFSTMSWWKARERGREGKREKKKENEFACLE